MDTTLSAAELHALHWETLRVPDCDEFLSIGERTRFSRYISSRDWGSDLPSLPDRLRVLAAVASPADLPDYGLSALDVAGDIQRMRAALSPNRITALASNGQTTLDNLIDHLRDGVDVCVLTAHGRYVDGDAYLWLEDEAGNTARVSGAALVTRIRELAQRPRLMVLSSCQSAGVGDGRDPLDALGPQLVRAGIPAVVAMSGNVSIQAAERFLPELFDQLRTDGCIDRAVAVARGAIRDLPDWFRPVLLTHLTDGRLWTA